jgi:hypothetical protein
LSNLPRRWPLVTPLVCAFLLLSWGWSAGQASARAYLPPAGEVFQGVAGQPISAYQQAVGKHPAVYQVFAAWGEYLPGIFADAAAARARLMIHITTASGTREMITPEGIADGEGDAWLIALNHAMYASGHVTYIRLMAEMDAYWNPYSAFNADGSPAERVALDRRVQAGLEAGHPDPPRPPAGPHRSPAGAPGHAEPAHARRPDPAQGRDAVGASGGRRA